MNLYSDQLNYHRNLSVSYYQTLSENLFGLFKNSLNKRDVITTYSRNLDALDESNSHIDLYPTRQSNFIEFFKQSGVDTPNLFKTSRSLYRPSGKIDYLKFVNYLMRDGKRWKSLKLLNNIFFTLKANPPLIKNSKRKIPIILDWKQLHLLTTTVNYKKTGINIRPRYDLYDKSHYQIISNSMYIHNHATGKQAFFHNFERTKPIFLFYIYKVDKKIFKNSRGKSGKFTFIWKYIPTYKRYRLILYWLVKELSLRPGQSIYTKVDSMLNDFVNDPEKTWIWKIKKFSHFYVYKNSRKSICENYRTVTK